MVRDSAPCLPTAPPLHAGEKLKFINATQKTLYCKLFLSLIPLSRMRPIGVIKGAKDGGGGGRKGRGINDGGKCEKIDYKEREINKSWCTTKTVTPCHRWNRV